MRPSVTSGHVVVVGVDGTDDGRRALRYGLSDARRKGRQLRLVHVWRDPGFAAPRMPYTPSVLVHGQTVTGLLAHQLDASRLVLGGRRHRPPRRFGGSARRPGPRRRLCSGGDGMREESPMKALVVYESMFGNTEEVARAVAHGLADRLEVELREVSEAPYPVSEFLDLIVVGGPTHAFSMTKPATRTEAIRQGAEHGHEEVGLREWLAGLPRGPHSEMVATFDTRAEQVKHLPGSAARRASRLFDRLGYELIGRESFYVSGSSGPLEPGELGRAEAWGRHLAMEMALRSVGETPARRAGRRR
jgi:hypothetical protein